jgi:hypothetical protein
MKNISLFLIAFLAISLTSCHLYTKIYTISDPAVDFSKYKTFAWLPDNTDTSSLPYNNSIIHNNIRNYFGKSFAERGYNFNTTNPDVLLRISVIDKPKEKTIVHEQYQQPYYYQRYYMGSSFYYPYSFNYYYQAPSGFYTEKIDYLEGSISLEVFDRKTNKLIWTGTAKGDIYDPAYISSNIHPAVCSIMKKYPVKPIKK